MFEEGLGAWEKAYKTLVSVWENTQIKVFDSGRKIFTEPLNVLAEFIRRIQDIPTVATAAFGLLATKMGTIFQRTRKELDVIAEKQFGEKLAKNQNAFQNASIAHAATNAASGIQLNPNIKDGYIQLQRELQGLTTRFDMNTKYGIVLRKALNDLNVIVNANRTDTKKYQKALGDLTLQMQALSNKARHTKLDVIANNMQSIQRTSTSIGGTIQGVFTKIGTGLKSFGTSILNLFGGWIGVIMTLATTLGTYLVSAWRKSTEAIRNANKTMDETVQRNHQLNSSFISLIGILRNSEQSSVAWQSAMSKLKREYPELLEKLHLEQISVNQSAQEYAKLRDRIKEVIEWQKQYNLYESALKGREELMKGYFESRTFKSNKSYFEDILGGYKFDDGVIKVITDAVEGNMKSLIANGVNDDAMQSELTKVIEGLIITEDTANDKVDKLKKVAELFGRVFTTGYRFSKERKGYDEITRKYLNKPEDIKTTQDVDKLLKDATDKFSLEREKIYQKADAQKWDKDKLRNETANLANTILEELTNNLQNLTYNDLKGDKHNALDYAKNQQGYQSLIQQSKLGYKSDLTNEEKQIKNAQEQYKSAMDFATRQLELGYINEMEYNKKKLSAMQALINSYETNNDVSVLSTQTYKDLINQQESLIKTLAEQENYLLKKL